MQIILKIITKVSAAFLYSDKRFSVNPKNRNGNIMQIFVITTWKET